MAEPSPVQDEIIIGDTFRRTIEVWQDAANTIPADLSGSSATYLVKNELGGNTLATGTITINTNSFDVLLTNTTTANLKPWIGIYEAAITWSNGDSQTILAGVCNIREIL